MTANKNMLFFLDWFVQPVIKDFLLKLWNLSYFDNKVKILVAHLSHLLDFWGRFKVGDQDNQNKDEWTISIEPSLLKQIVQKRNDLGYKYKGCLFISCINLRSLLSSFLPHRYYQGFWFTFGMSLWFVN